MELFMSRHQQSSSGKKRWFVSFCKVLPINQISRLKPRHSMYHHHQSSAVSFDRIQYFNTCNPPKTTNKTLMLRTGETYYKRFQMHFLLVCYSKFQANPRALNILKTATGGKIDRELLRNASNSNSQGGGCNFAKRCLIYYFSFTMVTLFNRNCDETCNLIQNLKGLTCFLCGRNSFVCPQINFHW